MQVKEILRVKGSRLLSIEPGGRAVDAVKTMAEQNLGSLLVLDQERMVGILTFHELLGALAKSGGALGDLQQRAMGGRFRAVKGISHVAALVGAAMYPACCGMKGDPSSRCSRYGRWP